MRNLIKLASYLTDWQLFKKPNSTSIRENVVKDILSVDGEKFFHAKLPDGKTNPHWGTIETVDGKQVCKEGTVDLYVYEHPDLNYRITDVPLGTCKEGEFNNVTEKDCRIIRDVLYTSHNKTSSYINLKLASNPWYILYRKSGWDYRLFIFLLALVQIACRFGKKVKDFENTSRFLEKVVYTKIVMLISEQSLVKSPSRLGNWAYFTTNTGMGA